VNGNSSMFPPEFEERDDPESDHEYAPSDPFYTARGRLTPKKFDGGNSIGNTFDLNHRL